MFHHNIYLPHQFLPHHHNLLHHLGHHHLRHGPRHVGAQSRDGEGLEPDIRIRAHSETCNRGRIASHQVVHDEKQRLNAPPSC